MTSRMLSYSSTRNSMLKLHRYASFKLIQRHNSRCKQAKFSPLHVRQTLSKTKQCQMDCVIQMIKRDIRNVQENINIPQIYNTTLAIHSISAKLTTSGLRPPFQNRAFNDNTSSASCITDIRTHRKCGIQ